MSVQRSPPQRPITCDDCGDSMGSRSESQPDLRQAITFRKRKHPDDDFTERFEHFEEKIMMVLTGMAHTQNEKLEKISKEVSSITDQICQIKITTEKLVADQKNLRQEFSKIAEFRSGIENKIETLEKNFGDLKSEINKSTQAAGIPDKTQPLTSQTLTYESMISEMQERTWRERNIIISGIQETNSANPAERLNNDKHAVVEILKQADFNCPEPVKIIRLGKYQKDKSRPIKACFASADTAKTILRNKSKINDESSKIKCYSDQTPNQKRYLSNLREELSRRTDNGEQDLTIKFIKGIPKIVQAHPKNETSQRRPNPSQPNLAM